MCHTFVVTHFRPYRRRDGDAHTARRLTSHNQNYIIYKKNTQKSELINVCMQWRSQITHNLAFWGQTTRRERFELEQK